MQATEPDKLIFKVATEDWEFREIHRLNYQTFVKEIPQHPDNPEQCLVDRFHGENTYFIALRGTQLEGMVALRTERPFSLDQKLEQLDQLIPAGYRPCEIRLLATRTSSRNGAVFRGLIDTLVGHALDEGFDLGLISGILRQVKLYRHLGFEPFGPEVLNGQARYQPMYLTLDTFRQHAQVFSRLEECAARSNFLPGPVEQSPRVREVLGSPAVSHRSPGFIRDFQKTRCLLMDLTGAGDIQITMGSGTLANDIVGAELSQMKGPGLVLSNGAFGERLVDHGKRLGLQAEVHRAPWGEGFDWSAVEAELEADPSIGWLWCVHTETSTGVQNDLTRLKNITRKKGVQLAIDAVSSLGTVPVDLRGVELASGVSGKGLRSIPGLALVFRSEAPQEVNTGLARYLDGGYAAAQDGIPFTISSNQVLALKAALEEFTPDRFARLIQLSAMLREGLAEMGLAPLASDNAFPAVTTVQLPPAMDSVFLGRRLEQFGYLTHYRSSYLVERNWIQFCMMGPCSREDIKGLLAALKRCNAAFA